MIKILLVEDENSVREAYRIMLNLEDDFEVVAEAKNGQQALDELELLNLRNYKPDVILMDIQMPVMNGLEATKAIKQKSPESKIVILTTFDDDKYAQDAVLAGAMTYVLKADPSADLVGAIRNAHRGISQFSRGILDKITLLIPERFSQGIDLTKLPVNELTSTEKKVLKQLSTGANNQEIADDLYMAVGTVTNSLTRISLKLLFEKRLERTKLALLAFRLVQAGILSDDACQ